MLPVYPAQSFSANNSTDAQHQQYQPPDTVVVPTPRNTAKEAIKRPAKADKIIKGVRAEKSAKKTRKSWGGTTEKAHKDTKVKKMKKRTKSFEPKVKPETEAVKENVYSHSVNHDMLASDLENNFSSPLRMLLQSPPHNFTSTPFKDKPLSGLRVTPIKNGAPKGQSTPKLSPWRCTFFSPGAVRKGGYSVGDDHSILSNRSFNLSIPGLTPLKDRENQVALDSSSGNVSMNDSLGRLLSDFQYDDNLLDCGVLPMDMDMANASFSQISNLQQL